MTLRLGSLFAGVGGFDLGFERAGFKTEWAVEIDPKAQAVLRRRFPSAALHGDVREVGAHNLGPVDVLTFGSPCQDLSVAGKRAGLAGGRSGLFHAATRVIRELRDRYGKPDLAIWENVPGAFSSNDGHDFEAVLRALANVGALDIGWRVLDSRWFGVAQRRRRILLVADFRGQRADEVLALRESVQRHTEEKSAASKKVARGAREGAPRGHTFRRVAIGKYSDDGTASAILSRDFKEYTDLVCGDVSGALCAGDGPRGVQHQFADDNKLVATFVQPVADPLSANEQRTYTHEGSFGFRTRNVQAFEERPTVHTLEVRGRNGERELEWRTDGTANCLRTPNGGRDGLGVGAVAMEVVTDARGIGDGLVSPTLRAESGSHQTTFVATPILAPTLTASNDPSRSPQSAEVTQQVAAVQEAAAALNRTSAVVRRLTPTECCRLQGFPDDWNVEGIMPDGRVVQMPDSARYKQMGNAVTVNVAEYLARRIAPLLSDK